MMASESYGLSIWQLAFVITFLLLPILYQTSHVFKYYAKLTFFYTSSMVLGVFVVLYSLRRPFSPSNHKMVTLGVIHWLAPFLGVDMEIRGREHLKGVKAAIIVVNHQSSLDVLPLFRFWPENTVCIAKKELMYMGPFGLGALLCGTIFIDRLNPERARKTIVDTSKRIKDNKYKVVIFPEGTRNHGDSMLPFKKGAFHLAVQAQVPIIPMVFSTISEFYSKKEKHFGEGKVLVQVLPPIDTDGLTGDNVTELTEKTRDLMMETYVHLKEELKNVK